MTYPSRQFHQKTRGTPQLPHSIDFNDPKLYPQGVNGTSCFACNKAGYGSSIIGVVPTQKSAALLEQMLQKRGVVVKKKPESQEAYVIISSCASHVPNLSSLFELIKKRSNHITIEDVKEAYRTR